MALGSILERAPGSAYDIADVRHERVSTMSSESVASGACHSRLPMITGMIARLPITTHERGVSMASIVPTVTTIPADDANTRSFR